MSEEGQGNLEVHSLDIPLDTVPDIINPGLVTQDDITALKAQINQSLSILIEMFVSLEDRFDALDDRLAAFNTRSSHKI